MSETKTGGCLCGEVRYEVTGPADKIIACHCVNCRKTAGAGISHNIAIRTEQLTITQGEPKMYVDTAASGNHLHRFFCASCGSSLFSRREKVPEMTVVKAGSLDDSSDARVVMNIWTNSALPWVYQDPALESHAQNRPPPPAAT